MKNRFDFCNDFESTFSGYWVDFGSKNHSKMKGLRVSFQPCYEYVKSVIWNNPPIVLLYFSTLKASIFDLKRCIFQMFFRKRFYDVLFLIFGRILVEIGAQMGAKIDEKINENLS